MTDNSPAKRALLAREEVETLLHGLRSRDMPTHSGRTDGDEHSLTIELGRTTIHRQQALALAEGSTVPLDKRAAEPVDLLVDGKLIGRGEIVVVNDKLGVRVLEVVEGKLAKAG